MPYGTTQCKWDSVIDLDSMWLQLNRICKPNTAILLFSQMPFSAVLVNSNIRMFRYEIIWEKALATGHLNAKKMFMKAHENIVVFYNKLPTFNPQMTKSHSRKEVSGNPSDLYGEQNKLGISYDSDLRYPRSVQYFNNEAMSNKSLRFHPTQKPLLLIEYLIKTYSNDGDVVLDFCMGSGTTGLACKNLNRKFIGIEKEKEYFDLAAKRMME